MFTLTHCIDDEREALQVGLAKRIRHLRPGSHLWLVMKGLRFANPTCSNPLRFGGPLSEYDDSRLMGVNTP